MKLFFRLFLTLLAFAVMYAGSFYVNMVTDQITVQAGDQFSNDATTYWNAVGAMKANNLLYWGLDITALALLFFAWRGPVMRGVKWWVSALALPLVAFMGHPALAYYNQENWPENVMIQPNESAFWVPVAGDKLNGQATLPSEDFYAKNRVSGGLFEVKHMQLPSSSYWKNFYVPAGRLYIVSREPVNSTWTHESGTGSSQRDQSFRCQSSEGIDVRADITIGAYITHEGAPRYMYWFPLDIAGDRTKPEVIFQSTLYAKPLKYVMDTVVWGQVSKLFCDRVFRRPLIRVNLEAADILKEAEADVKAYLETRGIALDYLGLAGTFTFEEEIQHAINARFVADTIAPVIDTLKTKALLEIATKWDGKLPQTLTAVAIPNEVPDILKMVFTKTTLPFPAPKQ